MSGARGGWGCLLAILAAPPLCIVAGVLGWGYVKSYHSGQILAHGLPGTALVQSLQDTDEREGGEPVEIVILQVTPQSGPAFSASVREQFSPQNALFFHPGNRFAVKYDAADPSQVVVPLGQTITVQGTN
jgi:hypothetical protein